MKKSFSILRVHTYAFSSYSFTTVAIVKLSIII